MYDQHIDCTEDSSCYCDQPQHVLNCGCGNPIIMKPRHLWQLCKDDDVICSNCENGE